MIARDRNTSGDDSVLEERLYALQDANFNVTAVADTSGDIVERYLFDPYGQRTILDPNFSTDAGNTSDFAFMHGHQGGKYDSVLTNQMLFRHRVYDVETARWLTEDPAGYGDGLNLFLAYKSLPNSQNDPSGLDIDFSWHWHHVLDLGSFGPTRNGGPSYLESQGIKLDEGIDTNAQEHGVLIRGKDHVGETGIHPEWEKESRTFINAWKIANPDKKVFEQCDVDQFKRRMKKKFRAELAGTKPAEMSYTDWKKRIYDEIGSGKRGRASRAAAGALVFTLIAGASTTDVGVTNLRRETIRYFSNLDSYGHQGAQDQATVVMAAAMDEGLPDLPAQGLRLYLIRVWDLRNQA